MSFQMANREPLYRPLDRASGEIRLLTVSLLEPGIDKKSPIQVEMRHVPLNEADGTYIALSYTWGEVRELKTICLNGHEVKVRDNLYDFLIRFRECMTDRQAGNELFETYELTEYYRNSEASGFFKEDELKYSEMGEPLYEQNMPIWIDALCLDQKSIPELNDNVPRMKDIYEKAMNVIIWLGNESETTKEAMSFLQQTRMKFGEDRQVSLLTMSMHGMTGGTGNPEPRLGPAANLDEWAAVVKLFDHPYWKRMWVVQELAYSFRVASIWCGRRQLHAHSLAKVQRAYFGDELGDTGMRDYTHPRYDRADNIPLSLVHGGVWPIEIIYDLADKPHQLATPGTRSTREIMSVIRTRKATLPHDMIYALYHLIASDPGLPLMVDYGRTIAQVFCDFMEYELAVSSSLQIWQLLTERKSTVDELPSWAVDWTAQEEKHQPIHIKSAFTPQGPKDRQDTSSHFVINSASMRVPELVPPNPDVNSAGGNTTATVRIIEPCKRIAVTGYLIGTIDDGGGAYKCMQQPDSEDGSFWEDMDDVISLLRQTSHSNLNKVLQVGSCLLFDDRIRFSDPEDTTYVKFYGEHLLDIALAVRSASPAFSVHFQDILSGLFLACLDESKVDRVPQRRQSATQLSRESGQRVRQNFWDRCWILNKRFEAIGLAPARAREGDTLCVPHGCPFVMVFHDEGDGTHSVVGTCWLYGFMHGEAVQKCAEGVLEEKEFVLV